MLMSLRALFTINFEEAPFTNRYEPFNKANLKGLKYDSIIVCK